MSPGKQSRGTCAFCGREMAKGGLTRHLKACPERKAAIAAADAEKGWTQKIYHLQVRDAWSSDFWLHLEMRGRATLADLDRYLRAIWLECCGHLSMFTTGGWGGKELNMGRWIEKVLEPGVELEHIYDFGTSSHTLVKALDARRGKPLTDNPIYLMARNNQPEVFCIECGRPATRLCMECFYESDGPGWLCDEHAEDHPHEDYGLPMPVVNSPRLGMCGYSGPAEPPY
jgi:hypothetical protein